MTEVYKRDTSSKKQYATKNPNNVKDRLDKYLKYGGPVPIPQYERGD